MIVDDAVVVRSLLVRWVDAEPDMEVIASLRAGREAVAQIESCDPDVVMLDTELDGISALPLLLQKKRDLVDHGLDLHAPQRRDQLARAVARRGRLHLKTAVGARNYGRYPRSAAN